MNGGTLQFVQVFLFQKVDLVTNGNNSNALSRHEKQNRLQKKKMFLLGVQRLMDFLPSDKVC